MKKHKKIISIFMLMIILISSLQGFTYGATQISSAKIIAGDDIDTNVEFYNGSIWFELVAKYVYYQDSNGNKYPAYCVSHGYDGVDERGDYTVDVNQLLQDEKIWRTIINGYPYKTAKELGVDSDEDAYFATKQAIYCVILDRDVSLYRGTTSSGKKIVEAIKNLKNIGLNGTQTMQNASVSINKSGSLTESGNYYYQSYTVTSNVNIGSFKIEKITGFPDGSYIANNQGSIQSSFSAGDTFRVMIPKSGLTEDINGSISVSAECATYPILYGETRIANTQNYAITASSYEDFTATTALNITTNTGKIQIVKTDDITDVPIEGVEFALLKMDGTQVATATTNAEGIATFSNLYQGTYQLKEIDATENYVLNETVFDVNVEYNKTTTQSITNESKKCQIKIIKLDEEDNEIVLEGVEFEILNEKGEVLETVVTDENGIALTSKYSITEFPNLQVRESKTLENYILSDEIKTVKLEQYEVTEVTFVNKKIKGQIEITKISADDNEITGEKQGTELKGAIFEIYDDNNVLVDTVTTGEDGKCISKELEYGTYHIKEISSGSKYYSLNTEEFTVQIKENGEIVSITIENTSVKPEKVLPKTGC